MTTDKKIIKARVGLLELARQLGNVSQACNIMGYSRDTFYRYKEMSRERGRGGAAGPLTPQADSQAPGRS